MNSQAVGLLNKSYAYQLMPGDGTAYRFGFFLPSEVVLTAYKSERSDEIIFGNRLEKVVEETVNPRLYTLFNGIGDGTDYVYFWIDMSSGKGFFEIDLYNLKQPQLYTFFRLHQMGKDVNWYSLVAVTLAVAHLVDHPDDLDGACKAMLQAPEWLMKIDEKMRNDRKDDDEESEDENDA